MSELDLDRVKAELEAIGQTSQYWLDRRQRAYCFATETAPALVAALEEAWRENEDWREISGLIENFCYDNSGFCLECEQNNSHAEDCSVGRLDYARQIYRAAEEG